MDEPITITATCPHCAAEHTIRTARNTHAIETSCLLCGERWWELARS